MPKDDQFSAVMDKATGAAREAVQEAERTIAAKLQEVSNMEVIIAEKTNRLQVLTEAVTAQEKKYLLGQAEIEKLREEWQDLQNQVDVTRDALADARKRVQSILEALAG